MRKLPKNKAAWTKDEWMDEFERVLGLPNSRIKKPKKKKPTKTPRR
jgi:hypothetical protein